MKLKELHKKLLELQDIEYRGYQSAMLPMIGKERNIGIRSAAIINLAKQFFDDKSKAEFLNQLPHKYFEEDLIHVWIIKGMKDYDECLRAVKNFLPYVDNWAVCDSLIPKIFAQHTDKLIGEIRNWLDSDSTYTVRFAILMLMKFYLNEHYDKKYLQMVVNVQSDAYYIEMAAAWFFVEALIKHYDDTITFLQERLIYPKIHTKTIQKAVESTRVSDDRKEYLKTLRRGYY